MLPYVDHLRSPSATTSDHHPLPLPTVRCPRCHLQSPLPHPPFTVISKHRCHRSLSTASTNRSPLPPLNTTTSSTHHNLLRSPSAATDVTSDYHCCLLQTPPSPLLMVCDLHSLSAASAHHWLPPMSPPITNTTSSIQRLLQTCLQCTPLPPLTAASFEQHHLLHSPPPPLITIH